MLESRSLFDAADQFITAHDSKKLELAALEREISNKKARRNEIIDNVALLEEVRVFLQELATATRDEIMSGLEMVVTLCLQSVFGPDISFEIEVDTARNNTAVHFWVVNEEGEHVVRLKPEDSMGGGVLDTISIGLRCGLMKVLNPMPIGPFFWDEPAKMVSGDKIESIGKLSKELRPMFGKQVIMITHHTPLIDIVDNPILVRKENGVTFCDQQLVAAGGSSYAT